MPTQYEILVEELRSEENSKLTQIGKLNAEVNLLAGVRMRLESAIERSRPEEDQT